MFKIWRFLFLFVFLMLIRTDISHATDPSVIFDKTIEYGIPKGSILPHNLAFADQSGQQRHFSELSGRNGIVLFFIRSAVWCPYCKTQLDDLSKKGSFLENLGWNIVVVSYDNAERANKILKERHFKYPFLADQTSEIIDSFDIRNQSFVPGTAYYGVSHPATYIIGKDGLILDKFFHEQIKIRPSIEKIRNRLREIGTYTPVLEKPVFQNKEESSN